MVSCCLRDSEGVRLLDLTPGQAVILGRNPVTKCRDSRVSRQQVSITCDENKKSVTVKQLGPNISYVNGKRLNKDASVTVSHHASIHLIQNEFLFQVCFLPCRQHDDNDDDTSDVTPEKPKESPKKRKRGSSPSETKDEAKAVEEKADEAPKPKKPNVAGVSEGKPIRAHGWEFHENDTIMTMTTEGVTSSSKIAGFDMDWTLIATASGRVFPKDKNDWKIIYPEVPGKLKQLVADGVRIVIFSNQKGMQRGEKKTNDFCSKVEAIIKKLGIPVQAIASVKSGGLSRKPATGMWDFLRDHCNAGTPISLEDSVYVGDAAGRPAEWAPKKKKDFSSADRLFALNVGVKFLTPEEYFMNQKPAPFSMPAFDPRAVDANIDLYTPKTSKLTSDTPEVVIVVGFPASGKSTFSKKHMIPAGYDHINRDTMGSWEKCVKACENALSSGKKAVIDNTNPDKATRKRYIDLAKKFKVPCRCFLLSTTMEQARHNNTFRHITDPSVEYISEMVFNMCKSKYEAPELSEGFEEILSINFKFEESKHSSLYKSFLIEK